MRGLEKSRKTPPPAAAQHQGTYTTYIVGFVMSVVLTLSAYFAVVNHWISGVALVAFITGLAVLQLLVQLVFFLHLSREGKPRWNLVTFLFAGLIVLIVVIGSLWIMYNLDYNMMPHEVENHIMEEERIYR